MFDGVPEEEAGSGPSPTGWEVRPLGKACEVNPSGRTVSPPDDSLVSFLPMAAVEELTGRIDLSDERTFGSVRKGYTRFKEGDVLFAKITPSMENGKVAIARGLKNGMGCGTTEFHVLRPGPDVLSEWLWYFTVSTKFRNDARHEMSGAVGQMRVPTGFLEDYPIPLPPLADQRRIVSRIEELFSQVEAGERAIGAARRDLARYRRSVLHAAVTGALTEDWRAANPDPEEDGEALLARLAGERRAAWERAELDKLTAKGKPAPETEKQWATFRARYEEAPSVLVEDLPDLPSSWAWATLPQLGEFGRGKSKHRPRGDASLYGGDYPFFQTGQVRQSLGKITTWDKTYNEKGLAQSRLWPEGTVCITIAANIAATGIMQFDGCFPDSVVGLIPHPDIGPEYPEFFLRTERDNLDEYAPATAQKNINLDILEQVAVPLPPIREQGELVSTVQVELSRADAVEKNLDAQTRAARALKQSVLKAAFAGQLA